MVPSHVLAMTFESAKLLTGVTSELASAAASPTLHYYPITKNYVE